MGDANPMVTLYSSQTKAVTRALHRDGVCFSRQEYVIRKYGESAPIFVAAYGWFVMQMPKYLPRPDGAEYPYWAFRDLYSVDQSADNAILRLCVPADEAVFFDVYDWNRILRLQYIGETEDEEQRFRKQLADYGVKRESDIFLTNFYPDLKRQVQHSWQRLFRHHERIKAGDIEGIGSVQVGLWQLKTEWVM